MVNNNETTARSSGIGFLGLLTIVFIALKLTGFINWSWWWVLAPLWGGLAFVVGIFIIVFIVVFTFKSFQRNIK